MIVLIYDSIKYNCLDVKNEIVLNKCLDFHILSTSPEPLTSRANEYHRRMKTELSTRNEISLGDTCNIAVKNQHVGHGHGLPITLVLTFLISSKI